MIDPRIPEGMREIAELLDGKIASAWLHRKAKTLERECEPPAVVECRKAALDRLAKRDLPPELYLGPLIGDGGYQPEPAEDAS